MILDFESTAADQGSDNAQERLVRAVSALPDERLDALVQWEGRPLTLGRAVASLTAYEPARAALEAALCALNWQPAAAARHLRWAPPARARLEAALLGVADELLDGRPFAGEWSVRQQLAHVELTDIRYGIATRYAVGRRDDEPLLPPDSAYPPRRAAPDGNPGEPLAAILARMRAVRAAAITPLLQIADVELLRPTEWHTAEHTVGFRLHRFGQHDLEIVSDLQRTLAALGYRPGCAIRLGAALVEARGERDALLLGLPTPLYDQPPSDGSLTVQAALDALHAAEARALALVQLIGAAGTAPRA